MVKIGKYLLLIVLVIVVAISIYLAVSKEKKQKYSDDPKYVNAALFDQDPLMNKRLILVNAAITESVASRVIKQLLVLESSHAGEPISLLINTPGGKRDQWQSIVQTMDFLESPVNVIAIGRVSSSGTYILANATGKKVIHERALIGVHMVFHKDDGEFSSARAQEKNIREYWSKVKFPDNFFPSDGGKFNEIFYLNAEQSLEYGLVDEIYRRESEPLFLFSDNTK